MRKKNMVLGAPSCFFARATSHQPAHMHQLPCTHGVLVKSWGSLQLTRCLGAIAHPVFAE